MHSRQHAGRVMSAFAAAGLAGSLLSACGGSSTSNPTAAQLEARLKAHNLATSLGGHLVTGTATGQRLVGGAGPYTIVGLAPNETIVGGGGPDQLAAYGTNATIVGGSGPAYIYGGGSHATLVSGSAPDLLVDTANNGTIRLTGNGNEVLLSGQNDHVVCTPTSHNDLVYDNRSDSVSSTCLANGAHVAALKQMPDVNVNRGHAPGPQENAAAATGTPDPSKITGSGTNADPYVAPCDDPADQDCTVTGAIDGQPDNAPYIRHLNGFFNGGNEQVPAYRCPTDHPYLLDQNFAPFGTSLVTGVEIQENLSPWKINVYIGDASTERPNPDHGLATGTLTGLLSANATNWGVDVNWYHPILHCTSNPSHGWQ